MGDVPPPQKRSLVIAVVVAALLAGGAGLLASRSLGDRSPLSRAADIAADRDRFDSGEEAARALAAISELLERAAEGCRGDAGDDLAAEGGDARCQATFALAGWTRVAAVGATRCTAPGRSQLRADTAEALQALDSMDDGDEPPRLARLPDCAALGSPTP